MHEPFAMIPVIVRNDRQWFQRGWLKTLQGPLPGFAMLSLVSDFREPLASLAIHVMQVGELTQWPEVLPCIADSALYLAFGEGRQMHRMRAVRANIFG
jgi:hypothetical protein